MAGTNPYFNNFNAPNEIALYESLIIEMISIYGLECYYLPRTDDTGSYDSLYNENDQRYFDKAIPIVVYIRNEQGFGGAGAFLSKFGGEEIRDTMEFTVARRTFMEEVGNDYNFIRPREGDLIYFSLNQKCFEISFVDKFDIFYQLGDLPTFTLSCPLFEYSSEHFTTGIKEIDSIEPNLTEDLTESAWLAEDGTPIVTEDGVNIVMEEYSELLADPFDNTDVIEKESEVFIDWVTNPDPFSQGLGDH